MPAVHHRWLMLFGVWLLYGCFGLVATSLAPLASPIIVELDMTHSEMGLVMGGWQLVYIASAVPAGMLLDKIGARPALAIGGLMIGLSALARGFATDTPTLLAAVMLSGLGGPIISAGAPKVVASHFEGAHRGLGMGIYLTGPTIGGIVSLALTNSLLLPVLDSWRGIMFLWAGLSIAASIIWFLLAGLQPADSEAVEQSRDESYLLVISKLLTKPTVLVVLLMGVSAFFFNHAFNNWLPEMLRSQGMTATEAGYWSAIPMMIGIAGSLLIPRLATPERRFFILMGLGGAAFAATLLLRLESEPLLFTGLLLQGIAKSSLMALLVLTLIELPEIGARYAGVASGMYFSVAEIGGVLGPLMLGVLYLPEAGFSSGLTLLSLVALILISGSVWLQLCAQRG